MQYSASYDVSGDGLIPGRPLVVVALVASARRLQRFEREWGALLIRHDIPYLHMTEFNACSGPFHSFKGDNARRVALTKEAIPVIKRGANIVIAHGILPADFNSVNEQFRLTEHWVGCYALATTAACGFVQAWMWSKHYGEPYTHIIQAGDDRQGPMRNAVLRGGYTNVTFKDSKDNLTGAYWRPFEACDLIAWEVAREWSQQLKETRSFDTRRSLLAILQQVPGTFQIFTREKLIAHCHKHDIGRRND